ncbi:MAG: hypothetical protein AAGB05_11710 [Pseudomonadota bacterium]
MRRLPAPRPFTALLAMFALAACDSPHPLSDFAGVPPTRVAVADSVYSVRIAGSRAHAVRRNVDLRATFNTADYVARAGLAMEQASGCRVRSGTLRGDASVSEARLAC